MTKNSQKIYDKIIDYKNKWSSFPTVNFLSHCFRITENDMKSYLVELQKENLLIFDNGKIQGMVKNDVTDINVVSKIETPIIKNDVAEVDFGNISEKPIEIIKPVEIKVSDNTKIKLNELRKKTAIDLEKKPIEIKKFKLPSKVFYFKIIIFICFVIFYYMGVKNNFIGFLKHKNNFDALISAIGFFSFSIVMLECFLFFIRKKIKWLFISLFLIMFSSNFFTILDGQIENYNKLNSEKNYIDEIEIIKSENKNLEMQLSNFQNELERQKEKKSEWFIRRLTFDDIPEVQNKIINNNKKIIELTKTTKKQTIIDNIWIQSFRFIITSFAMELIASISLALLFFLKK